MDDSEGVEWTHWCVGGKTNMVLNCQDRHRQIAIYEKTYLIWEGENGICQQFTYREFDKKVCKFASALKQLEYGKGDAVALYLPRIPETLMAYFSILKIGAVVMPLFSGFGPQTFAERLIFLCSNKSDFFIDIRT